MDESSNKKMIIAAEDDSFLSDVYRLKLEKEGFDLQVVSNGNELLNALKENIPDLIILDLIMPEMNGFEALKRIKETPEYANIKVIVMSNLGQEEDIARATELGASDYLIKANISTQQMVEKIKQNLV